MGKRLLNFIVFSNIFIAGCAVLMVIQTSRFLLYTNPDINFLSFVFFSTICSYSFHWYLTSVSVIDSPRIGWIHRNRYIHLSFFIVGLIGAGIFFFYLKPYWDWLLLSAIVTFLYTAPKIPYPIFRALRKVALGKTIFLAFVWTHVTTILPIIISDQPWKMEYVLFIISRFFLVYAICILFDYRDREDDKVSNIRSLITYLSEKGITYVFIFSMFVFFSTTIFLVNYHYPVKSVVLLLIPGIITAALYNYSRKNFHDLLYYFVLDGLMALSAALMLISDSIK